MSSRPRREPAKSTPFSSSSSAAAASGGSARRRDLTVSLRKHRRGQALARKRHAALPSGSGAGGNPYTADGDHVRDTVGAATGLVSRVSGGVNILVDTFGDCG